MATPATPQGESGVAEQATSSNSFTDAEVAQAKEQAILLMEIHGGADLSVDQEEAIRNLEVDSGVSSDGGLVGATKVKDNGDPDDGKYIITVYVYAEVLFKHQPDSQSRVDLLAFVLAHEVWHDPEIGGGSGGLGEPVDQGPDSPGAGSTTDPGGPGCSCDHIGQAYWDIQISCAQMMIVVETNFSKGPIYCKYILSRMMATWACMDVAIACKQDGNWPDGDDAGPASSPGEPGWGFPDVGGWLVPPEQDMSLERFWELLCQIVALNCPGCSAFLGC